MNMIEETSFAERVPPLASGPHRAILVVEDDFRLRDIYGRVLRHAGYQVSSVGNGEAGWLQLCGKHFDLLITDNEMAGLTGLDLVRRIRRQAPELPIMMISGALPWAAKDFIVLMTPGSTLEKPFPIATLLKDVATLIETLGPAPTLRPGPTCHVLQGAA